MKQFMQVKIILTITRISLIISINKTDIAISINFYKNENIYKIQFNNEYFNFYQLKMLVSNLFFVFRIKFLCNN